jgi:pSer/pThr/pTyr-binding forkhead associated (FHA) protein
MSDLLLTALRIGFLLVLWWFVLTIVSVLRRDLQAPRNAKPLTPARTRRTPSPRPSLRSRRGSTGLLIVEGPLAGTVIPLGTTQISIGRAPDSTVVLDDDFVSERHARLVPNGIHWMVEDLGSTNGTYVDRTRVNGPTVLKPGSTLRIGLTSLELRS